MTTYGSATLYPDEDGLVTLQCDRCKSRFKIECNYLNNDLQGDICCPLCGISESLNSYWPEEVVQEARRIALVEAEIRILDLFKGLNSKHIKIESNPVQRGDTNVKFKNRDYDMQSVKVCCCQKSIGLMPADITAGFYCPYCGRIVR